MTNTDRNRRPSGVPVGGQFAITPHDETDIKLEGADTDLYNDEYTGETEVPGVSMTVGRTSDGGGWVTVWASSCDLICDCKNSSGRVVWAADDEPHMFGSPGSMNLINSHQCGDCGSQVGPPTRFLSDNGDGVTDRRILEAAQDLATEANDEMGARVEAITAKLTSQVADAVLRYKEAGGDIEAADLDEQMEYGGPYVDGGQIEAWVHDPRDASEVIVVTAELPALD